MSTLYQSALWRTINEEIYKKPIGEITLGGSTYRTISKIQRKFGKTLRRTMVHGVVLNNYETYVPLLHEELQRYKRDHRADIFLQIGFITPWKRFATETTKQHLEAINKQKEYVERDLLTRYDVHPTVREHMPHATIVLKPHATIDEHIRACSDNGKRMINKAKKAGLTFVQAGSAEREEFWSLRYAMSYDKGFSVLPKEQFVSLMQFLTKTDQGRLFLAKKGGAIVSGSLCLRVNDELIYLYGATDRSFGHIGAHYRLTAHIAQWAHQHHCTSFDLLGIAPPRADDNHPLAGVTRFKQSFGGETIVSLGSYDLIISSLLYKAFQRRRTIK